MKDTLKLYFVCGTVDCSRKNILTVVEEALQAGITLFQFREKGFTALQGKEKLLWLSNSKYFVSNIKFLYY